MSVTRGGGRHAVEDVARRGARARQSRRPDRRVDAGLVAQGPGHLRPARSAQHPSPSVEANLRRLRSDVNLSGIFVRDYLLDVARERAPDTASSSPSSAGPIWRRWPSSKTLIARDDQIASLQAKLDDYWETFDPLFDWTPTEKILRSASFLRREVVPRREAALAIAQEIEELNNANLAAQRAEVARRHAAFRDDLHRLLWQTVLLGLGVALVVVRPAARARAVDPTTPSIRCASSRSSWSTRRKKSARTCLASCMTTSRRCSRGCGWSSAGSSASSAGTAGAGVAECKALVDDMFRTVRDLALGLRPSMLDDFGLQAGARMARARLHGPVRHRRRTERWTATSTRCRTSHRTCVYRIVQEALTNCVRHAARAEHPGQRARLRRPAASVGDRRWRRPRSGATAATGLGPARHRRARQGACTAPMTISPEAERGTTLAVRLPLPAPISGGAACACCWLTITASSGADCAACSKPPACRWSAEAADGLEADAALRGAPARPAHPRHRHAETERHRSRGARAEARSAARRHHPQRAWRRVVHHARARGRRARLSAEERDRRGSDSRRSAPSPRESRSSARPSPPCSSKTTSASCSSAA